MIGADGNHKIAILGKSFGRMIRLARPRWPATMLDMPNAFPVRPPWDRPWLNASIELIKDGSEGRRRMIEGTIAESTITSPTNFHQGTR